MTRRIVSYGGYFESFMETLTPKEQEKIKYGLLLLRRKYEIKNEYYADKQSSNR